MQRVVPWSELIALIEPHSPKGKTDRATWRNVEFGGPRLDLPT